MIVMFSLVNIHFCQVLCLLYITLNRITPQSCYVKPYLTVIFALFCNSDCPPLKSNSMLKHLQFHWHFSIFRISWLRFSHIFLFSICFLTNLMSLLTTFTFPKTLCHGASRKLRFNGTVIEFIQNLERRSSSLGLIISSTIFLLLIIPYLNLSELY